MDKAFNSLKVLCKAMNYVACFALTMMMALIVIDVLLRAANYPFVGTFEIVSLLMGVVVGFGIPQVSLDRGHVYMEFLVEKFPKKSQNLMNILTRILCLFLFICIGYNMINIGARFHASGEVSPTIKLPFYPLAYSIAVCCFVECGVFISEIVRIWRGEYE